MGAGAWTKASFCAYNTTLGKTYDSLSNRVVGQEYKARKLNESLNPKGVIRECVNTEEHPNTIPVILALDVTGSMGHACTECAEALGVIMENLYKNHQDIEFMVMGIGDLAYDSAPIQASQYESDVRIAEALDKLYMEHGGGGNTFESYTAAWYFGLHHTKLDCYDKQGRKGIIITMGDEPLNPYLPKDALSNATGDNLQADVETKALYEAAKEKFDIYHIAVDSDDNAYNIYKKSIKSSFGKVLGQRLKVSTIQGLAKAIEECVSDSVSANGGASLIVEVTTDENGQITW